MNKAAIKRFAVWARTKLMADIRTRLGFVGITEDEVKVPLPSSTKEIQYFQGAGTEPVSVKGKNILARKDLAEKLQKDARRSDYKTAYENLVETTASAWFNRLIAIRFMEVNDYLSDGIRMLSSAEAGKTDPDIVTAPFDSDLEFTEAEKEKIVQCKLNSETDRAFRILFFKRCHQLQKFLPGLFEKEGDATEFLMRLSVVDTDGVIYRLVHDIPEEDFRVSEGGQVEIIGWMYQYYNSELKDDTFAKLKKNIKVTKERIPSATQLFTPDWIVRYMVENSLGRLWIEHLRAKTPETDEKATAERFGWKYYLPEAKQEEAVEKQLMELRKPRADLKPEDIRCIDPCMGSGHILSYLFDVLMQIYEEEGYDARDAVEQIVTKNLYGLDIDDRAGQLAYFTVMMKVQQYAPSFFRRELQPNVQAIQESNGCKIWAEVAGDSLVNGQLTLDDRFVQMVDELIETFHDAKEYGSLLTVKADDYGGLLDYIGQMAEQGSNNLLFSAWLEEIKEKIAPLAKQAMWFSQKYDVVVTNPPYLGNRKLNDNILEFLNKNYALGKADLFSAFIIRCRDFAQLLGYRAMITQQAWMFLTTYEALRKDEYQSEIVNMAQLGTRAFDEIGGEVVQATTFVKQNIDLDGYRGTYIRLTEVDGEQEKEERFFNLDERYIRSKKSFKKIKGAPIVYWASDKTYDLFEQSKPLGDYVDTRQGLKSSDDKRFFRLWPEVNFTTIEYDAVTPDLAKESSQKWFLLNKGGRLKWYGDYWHLINWENDGKEIKSYAYQLYHSVTRTITSIDYYFKEAISWPQITSKPVFRIIPAGFIFNVAGSSMFYNQDIRDYLLAFLNTSIVTPLTRMLNPTVNLGVGDMLKIPFVVDEERKQDIEQIVKKNYQLAKANWDSFEISWDFQHHPLV